MLKSKSLRWDLEWIYYQPDTFLEHTSSQPSETITALYKFSSSVYVHISVFHVVQVYNIDLYFVESNVRTIMNEVERIRKAVDVACFKVLSQQLAGTTEKQHSQVRLSPVLNVLYHFHYKECYRSHF
jgi:hypothetical protein